MKSSFVLVVMTTIMAALAALPAPASAQSTLQRILESGEIRVGTTGDWNPMTMRDTATNTYIGFDIDVVTELAKDLGVKLTFVSTEWKTLVSGMVAGKYDISTSASITPSRIRTVGFTRSYYQVGTVPVALKKNVSRFTGWEAINRKDVRVAVTLGTSFEQQVKQFFPQSTIKAVEAPARDFQEVLSGRAEVSITSNLEASKLIRTYPQLAIVPVDKPRSPADLAFITPQNDQVWINYLNHWITIKTNRGFFEGLRAKWMPAN
jgi:cyclohexadienyl dehydratase